MRIKDNYWLLFIIALLRGVSILLFISSGLALYANNNLVVFMQPIYAARCRAVSPASVFAFIGIFPVLSRY